MNQHIRTVLFDLDGTLINTNELIIESFIYTFKQYGLHYTKEEIIQFNGPPLNETFAQIDAENADEMIKTYRDHNYRYHDQYVEPFPNVVDTVKQLSDAGVSLGIVSTKMRTGVEKGLRIAGLEPYFSTVITLDEVSRAKPDPEPVLKGMNELKGSPRSTIMIGDNSHDIEAGHRADVLTAGVSWAQRGEAYLEKYEPTYMLRDMRELADIIFVNK